MTYSEFIQNIIDTRGQWNIPDGEYYETHHIIPRCWGGLPNGQVTGVIHTNLIWLYPSEHYIAHKLLALENPNDKQILHAWQMMSNRIQLDNTELESLEYEKLKKLFIRNITGIKRTEEQKEHMRKPHTITSEGIAGIRNTDRSYITDEWKEKIGQLGRGRKWFNNGEINIKVYPDNVPAGFIPGRLKYSISENGWINIKNGIRLNCCKKVMCIETGEIFDSAKEAAILVPRKSAEGLIRLCCEGKQKQTCGYHFIYVKASDDLYFNGVFWVIANSYRDILIGNFKLKTHKYLVDINGNEIEKSSKSSKTHKHVWGDNSLPYDYYPRGRVNIYDGEVFINLNSRINLPQVINKIIEEFGIKKLIDKITIYDIDNIQDGNHYDFKLK